MAIYKLGVIGNFKGGISSLKKENYDTGINFVNYMDIFRNSYINNNVKLRKYNASKNEIKKYECKYGDVFFTASSETPKEIAFSSVYLSNKKAIFNGFSKRYRFDHSILNPKYAIYLFKSQNFRKNVESLVTGYIRFNISQSDLSKIKVNIPSLKIQQQIIDIIEPFESTLLKINKILDNVKKIMKRYSLIYYEITNKKYVFQKGECATKEKGLVPFLNVSAANGKVNRYVTNKANIFPGDVTISLDGNTGLVNNSLYGFNGYLYKVASPDYSNWEIYFSLKHPYNQRIIKTNESGTTIKHSPNSKKKIKHIKIGNKNLLKNSFYLIIKIEEMITKLSMVKNNLITLLIK